jgi:hypothetical protein
MGATIGVELRALWLQGVGENHGNNFPHLGLDCWSPNINVARDPRWGRSGRHVGAVRSELCEPTSKRVVPSEEASKVTAGV